MFSAPTHSATAITVDAERPLLFPVAGETSPTARPPAGVLDSVDAPI